MSGQPEHNSQLVQVHNTIGEERTYRYNTLVNIYYLIVCDFDIRWAWSCYLLRFSFSGVLFAIFVKSRNTSLNVSSPAMEIKNSNNYDIYIGR